MRAIAQVPMTVFVSITRCESLGQSDGNAAEPGKN
jgi:hypothetical protein